MSSPSPATCRSCAASWSSPRTLPPTSRPIRSRERNRPARRNGTYLVVSITTNWSWRLSVRAAVATEIWPIDEATWQNGPRPRIKIGAAQASPLTPMQSTPHWKRPVPRRRSPRAPRQNRQMPRLKDLEHPEVGPLLENSFRARRPRASG